VRVRRVTMLMSRPVAARASRKRSGAAARSMPRFRWARMVERLAVPKHAAMAVWAVADGGEEVAAVPEQGADGVQQEGDVLGARWCRGDPVDRQARLRQVRWVPWQLYIRTLDGEARFIFGACRMGCRWQTPVQLTGSGVSLRMAGPSHDGWRTSVHHDFRSRCGGMQQMVCAV
jgi:hypothetical protein